MKKWIKDQYAAINAEPTMGNRWGAIYEGLSDDIFGRAAGNAIGIGFPVGTYALFNELNPTVAPYAAGFAALLVSPYVIGKARGIARDFRTFDKTPEEIAEMEAADAAKATRRRKINAGLDPNSPEEFTKFDYFKHRMKNKKLGAAALGGGAVTAATWARLGLQGMYKSVGGISGIAGGTVGLAHTLGSAAFGIAKGSEAIARTVLTGGIGGVQPPMQAWFPFYNTHKPFMHNGKQVLDIRRYAPNPKIVRRATGIAAMAALGSFVNEAINPMIAPPSAYFDGRWVRHTGSMGADADYGQAMLGRNSAMNVNYNVMMRQMAAAF